MAVWWLVFALWALVGVRGAGVVLLVSASAVQRRWATADDDFGLVADGDAPARKRSAARRTGWGGNLRRRRLLGRRRR